MLTMRVPLTLTALTAAGVLMLAVSSALADEVTAEFLGPGGGQVGLAGTFNQVGQSFTALVGGEVTTVDLSLKDNGTGLSNLHLSIFETDLSGLPTGSALGQADLAVTLPEEYEWFTFDFSSAGIALDAGTLYALLLNSDPGDAGYRAETTLTGVDGYQDGRGLIYFTGGPWEHMGDNFIFGERDVLFSVSVESGAPSPDLDGNGTVDVNDLLILLGAWGTAGPGDLNEDGTVAVEDLLLLLAAWG
jgi:hypothetical protein